MESITVEQLGRYETILESINNESRKSEELKKELEKENNKIILLNLTNLKNNKKLSYSSVKVFSNLFHLISLYEDELRVDIGELVRCQNCKYYLIEVYIAKALSQKFKGSNCLINFTIKTENKCISKSVEMPKQLPLVEIITVDENVIDCSIDTCIIFPDENWMQIELDRINVDISYHFQKVNKSQMNTLINEIIQLSKKYGDNWDFREFKDEMILEYELRCEIDQNEFMEAILKNSYHNLSMDHFIGLTNDDKKEFILEFSHGFGKHEIRYNKKNRFNLKSNVDDLRKLKKYFCELFHKKAVIADEFPSIDKLEKNMPLSIQEVRSFYYDLRKCWANLPV